MFRLNSGPEKYQKIINDALKTCIGVANIADGIIVHGKGQKEHYGQLDTVLCMLSECGLTLNKKKRQFCPPKLSTRGTDASEEKSVGLAERASPPIEISSMTKM